MRRRKSEWEHCAPDGSASSPHLDAVPPRDPVPLLFHNREGLYNTKGTTITVMRLTSDNSRRFMDSVGFIAMRFRRNLRELEAWASFIP